MGYKITVPKAGEHESKVVWCNVDKESEALRIAETLVGYQVSGLPYIVSECGEEMLKAIGIETGSCALG